MGIKRTHNYINGIDINLDCGSNCCEEPHIVNIKGEKTCTNCGVISGLDIVGIERRAYSEEEVNERRHHEPTWRVFGPRTIIPINKKDFKNESINSKNSTLFSRLSKIQNSVINSLERNYWEALPKLKMLSLKLNLPPHIKELAWRIYTIAAQKKLTIGRSIDGFIVASIYAAIRIHEFPKILQEVCEALMTKRHGVIISLSLIIKKVLPELGLKYKPITAETLICRFSNEMGLPMNIQKEARDILEIATINGLERSGKNPKGLAASAIYTAIKRNNLKFSQKYISDIANITEVTLRSRTKQIENRLKTDNTNSSKY
ncbi:MAG: transcription initiation factor IIB family protein [Promethearchaeota archaeon]